MARRIDVRPRTFGHTSGIANRAAIAALLTALALVSGGCGSGDSTEATGPTTPTVEAAAGDGASVTRLTVDSEAVGRPLDVRVVVPAAVAGERRALLVFLHGAGGSSESFVANEAMLAALAQQGEEAPIVAFPEGELSWWHDRANGDWGRYVVREVIPAVRRGFGVDPRRVAIGGISMGGYGAYHLGTAYPRRFCAVGGHSAGLWTAPEDQYPGAFDDPEDQAESDVIATVREDPGAFARARIWNDYGDEDWFVAGNAAFVEALRAGGADLSAHVWPGGHDAAYWDRHWPAYLRFYADALASCD